MKTYYNKDEVSLRHRKAMLLEEIRSIDQQLWSFDITEDVIKNMLFSRYNQFKKETGRMLIVKYCGGNSCDPGEYKYYEANEITNPNYESEITKDYLYYLNMNRHKLEVEFEWLD